MSQPDSSVNQGNIDLQQSVKQSFKAIRQLSKPLTKAEIQMQTGLALFKVEDAMYVLMEKYPCKLEVNEKGQIVYDFDLDNPRYQKGWRDILKNIADFTGHFCIFIFKLIITVVFFSYALTIGLAVALVISVIGKTLQPLGLLFLGLIEAVRMMFIDIKSFFTKEKPTVKSPEKNLIAMVFAFAFGSERYTNKLGLEKKILEYISLNNYKITATDLVMITGWSVDKCNEELSLMLTQYRANIHVTEEGVLIYHFPEFDKISPPEQKKTSNYFIWNNLHQLLPYNNNKKTANKTIKGIAIFSVIVSFIVMAVIRFEFHLGIEDFVYLFNFSGQENLGLSYAQARNASIALYLFLFFIFFLFSSFIAKAKNDNINKKKSRINCYYKYLKVVFAELPIVYKTLFKGLSEKEKFNLSYNLRGKLKTCDQDASLYYDFSHLQLEMQAAQKQREGNPYPEINIDDFKEAIEKAKSKKELYARIKKKALRQRGFKFKHALLIFIFLLLASGIYYFKDIQAIIRTQNAEKFTKTSVTVDHGSIFYPYFHTNNYQNIERLTIKNATKERPVPKFDSTTQMERLKILSANCDLVFPKKMAELERLTLKDINGKITLPEKIPILIQFIAHNINSELHFPIRFKYLSNLEIKNNHNKLVYLPKSVSSANKIYIERARLDSSMQNILYFHGLEYLHMVNCGLTQIPDSIDKIYKLEKLDLADNQLTTIPKNLDLLEDLYEIDLSGNKIDTLPDSLNVSILTEIDLSNNKITRLPATFWSYKCSQMFLNKNQISILPEPDTSTHISQLWLSENKLTGLPKKAHFLSSIYSFDLSKNQLTSFPNQVTDMNSLTYLNLDNNQINEIPANINQLKKLNKLHIAGNPIKKVSKNLSELKNNNYGFKIYIDKKLPENVISDIKKYVGVQNVYFK